MRRIATALVAAGLLVPASASAHVSVHPNAVPAGANATLDIRVPNEMDNAKTTKLQVQFPPGFIGVSTQPPPGWTSKVQTSKLAKPVQTDDGPIDTQVSEVDWTAGSGAGIPAGQFAQLPDLGRAARPPRPDPDLQDRADLQQRPGRPLDRRPRLRPASPHHRRDRQGRRPARRRRRRGRTRAPARRRAGRLEDARRPRRHGPWSRSNPPTTRSPSSRSSSASSDSPPAPPVSWSPGARGEVSASPSEPRTPVSRPSEIENRIDLTNRARRTGGAPPRSSAAPPLSLARPRHRPGWPAELSGRPGGVSHRSRPGQV